MKGYKVFNEDWTCRDYQFEVGKTYEHEGAPECCENGFHFCENLADCFNYYNFNPNNKVAEIEAIGDIDFDNNDKHCTNRIKIIRELSWNEVLEKVNTGKDNTGHRNSGYYNSGDCNSGYSNSGDWNSGYYNSGDWNSGNYNSGHRNSGNYNSGNRNSGYSNSGDWNSGNYNSGNYNSGHRNSGDYNSGHRNSGDWNKSNNNSGCFNTEQHKLMFFDKPTDVTFDEWRWSEAYSIMNRVDFKPTVWIYSDLMTDQEKKEHPSYETTGGYLKKLDNSDCHNIWWNSLNDNEKEVVKNIPNFDSDKFYEITGVRV